MPRVRRDIVDELAAIGPFFGVDTHASSARVDGEWQMLHDLLSVPERLDRRVSAVQAALTPPSSRADPHVEIQVAASITQLGLVARILAPVIAVAALTDQRVSLCVPELWWQDRLGGPFPLSVHLGVPSDARSHMDLDGSAVEAVSQAVAERYAVSGQVLWGNVASAVNSAAQQLTAARPDAAQRAAAIAAELLANPRLHGEPAQSSPAFRRNSCCLIYRLAGDPSAVCGDCVLGSPTRGSSCR
jgi:hypothetical protein